VQAKFIYLLNVISFKKIAKLKMADKPDQKPAPQKQPEPEIPYSVTQQLDEVMRRLRLLEDRYSGLRKKEQFTEQNMLRETKSIIEEISMLNSTIADLKGDLSELSEKMGKLAEEVSDSVKKTEFNVVAKYLGYWQPMNFITKKEAEKIIQEYRKQ
jgi:uncharacterized protein YoxC